MSNLRARLVMTVASGVLLLGGVAAVGTASYVHHERGGVVMADTGWPETGTGS